MLWVPVMLVPPKTIREPSIEPVPDIETIACIGSKPSPVHFGGFDWKGEPCQKFDLRSPFSDVPERCTDSVKMYQSWLSGMYFVLTQTPCAGSSHITLFGSRPRCADGLFGSP